MPSSSSRKKRRRVETEIEVDVKSKGSVTDGCSGEFNLVKFFNQIFSENKSHAHRVAAIEIMCDQLTSLTADDVHAQAQLWIGYLMKAIDVCKCGSARELALCCHTISQLLLLCVNSPELCRVISLNIVPKLLTSLLDVLPTEQVTALTAVVHVMKVCVKYFGGSCLSYKNKVEAFLIKVVLVERENVDSLLLKTCLTTLSCLPCCGGQGSSGSKHSEMWYNQLCRLLDVVDGLTTYLYASCGVDIKGNSKKVTSGQAFPTVTDDNSINGLKKAALYLPIYLKALQAMISTPFTWKVQIPVKHLLAVVCNVTCVTPDSVVFKRKTRPEIQIVLQALPLLHNEALGLVSSLANLSGSCLYPYTTTICELLNNQLNWTKAMHSQSAEEIYVESRTKVLDAICSLISEPGLNSMLSGISCVLVEQALYDLTLTPVATEVKLSQLTLPAVKRARKQARSMTSHLTSVSTAADRSRRLSALALIRQLLCYTSSSLTTRLIKMVYDHIVALVLSVQTPSATDCYSRDSRLRHALYQCLMASVHSYNSEVGPLTHIASQLISSGVLDTCADVRSLCNQAMLVCQLAVEPRAPPLAQNSSAYVAESPTKIISERNNSDFDLSKVSSTAVQSSPADDTAMQTHADNTATQTPADVTDIQTPSGVIADAADDLQSNHSDAKETTYSRMESPAHSSEMNEVEMETNKPNELSVESRSMTREEGGEAAESPSVETAAAHVDESSAPVDKLSTADAPAVSSAASASTTETQVPDSQPVVQEEPAGEQVLDMMNTFVSDGPDE